MTDDIEDMDHDVDQLEGCYFCLIDEPCSDCAEGVTYTAEFFSPGARDYGMRYAVAVYSSRPGESFGPFFPDEYPECPLSDSIYHAIYGALRSEGWILADTGSWQDTGLHSRTAEVVKLTPDHKNYCDCDID